MIRTFIYGSCVSRDTFEFMDKDRFSLLRYVARSSLISAFAPPTTSSPAGTENLSPFQRRQLEDDFRSALPSVLDEFRGSIDLILWDLTDERLGVYLGPAGQVVSDSLELRKLGKGVMGEEWRHVPLGTDDHFGRFSVALQSWRNALLDRNLLDRVVLLGPPWASHGLDGEPAPTSFGIAAEDANRAYARYYDAVRNALGAPILGRDLTVATDKRHVWSAAPFHYARGVYESLIEQLTSAMGRCEEPGVGDR